jgi:hypothetical protein
MRIGFIYLCPISRLVSRENHTEIIHNPSSVPRLGIQLNLLDIRFRFGKYGLYGWVPLPKPPWRGSLKAWPQQSRTGLPL